MRLKIMDYLNEWHDTGIDVDESVAIIEIEVVTGDHIAHITYSDGRTERIESCFDRLNDYADGNLVIFDREKGIDLVKEYLSIKETYDIFDIETSSDKRLENVGEWLPKTLSRMKDFLFGF